MHGQVSHPTHLQEVLHREVPARRGGRLGPQLAEGVVVAAPDLLLVLLLLLLLRRGGGRGGVDGLQEEAQVREALFLLLGLGLGIWVCLWGSGTKRDELSVDRSID